MMMVKPLAAEIPPQIRQIKLETLLRQLTRHRSSKISSPMMVKEGPAEGFTVEVPKIRRQKLENLLQRVRAHRRNVY